MKLHAEKFIKIHKKTPVQESRFFSKDSVAAYPELLGA